MLEGPQRVEAPPRAECVTNDGVGSTHAALRPGVILSYLPCHSIQPIDVPARLRFDVSGARKNSILSGKRGDTGEMDCLVAEVEQGHVDRPRNLS